MGLLILLLVLSNSARNVYKKKKSAEETLVRIEREAEELKSRDAFLKKSIERITTQEGLEFEIRKKLNVAEIGESVAIIVDQGSSTVADNSQTSAWQKFRNFWVKLFK